MRAHTFHHCGIPILLGLAIGCTETADVPMAPQGELALTTSAMVKGPLHFKQVSASDGGINSGGHTCGITTKDQAYCWGDNRAGDLGTGTTEGAARPTPVSGPGHHLRQISAGVAYSCGVTATAAVYCWGQNSSGQLGDGSTTQRPRPTRIASRLRFREVSAGWSHTCAVTTDNVAYCWGANFYGLGDGSSTQSSVPVQVAGGHRFRQVSAGWFHSCGVTTDDVAYCWGWNGTGQLGIGSDDEQRSRPAAIAGGLAFAEVTVGIEHSCGVTTDHQAYCWGRNSVELGSQPGSNGGSFGPYQLTPRPVEGEWQDNEWHALVFRSVTAARERTCGVTTSNVAYCWGRGILGDGTQNLGPTPARVAGNLQFRQIDAGSAHTCGVTVDDLAYCWGSGGAGVLGNGSFTERLTPVAVLGPSKPGSGGY